MSEIAHLAGGLVPLDDALPNIWMTLDVVERHAVALGYEIAESGRTEDAVEGMLAGGATVEDLMEALVLHDRLDRLPKPGRIGRAVLRLIGFEAMPYAKVNSRSFD